MNFINEFDLILVKIENRNGNLKKYLLVMEYADANSLQNYLKENFKKLTWENKYKLAYQLIFGISYLHDEEIIHRNLVIYLELL